MLFCFKIEDLNFLFEHCRCMPFWRGEERRPKGQRPNQAAGAMSCQKGQTFDVGSGRCQRLVQPGSFKPTEKTRSRSCPLGMVFCVAAERCVPQKAKCRRRSINDDRDSCRAKNLHFCPALGACLAKKESCNLLGGVKCPKSKLRNGLVWVNILLFLQQKLFAKRVERVRSSFSPTRHSKKTRVQTNPFIFGFKEIVFRYSILFLP